MSQIYEALRQAESLEAQRKQRKESVDRVAVERRANERQATSARIRVYGHKPEFGPFFEENPVLNVSPAGALLVMKIPVVAGQKLLLINEAAEQVQECRVVRTACRNTHELEVAVEFPIPQPEFWHRMLEAAASGHEKRTLPRIALPRGMAVTWKRKGELVVSRVQDISAAGLSIASPEPASLGEQIEIQFTVPAGEVNARAIVRHVRERQGMGVELVDIAPECRARLNHLVQKLLG
jgi:PilZ domain-containing protein